MHFFTIQGVDGLLGFAVIRHFYKAITTRAARTLIKNDLGGHDLAKGFENGSEFFVADVVRKIAYVDIHSVALNFAGSSVPGGEDSGVVRIAASLAAFGALTRTVARPRCAMSFS